MKKFAVISTALAAVLAAGALSVTAFAASDPADDAGDYSYTTGQQAYEERMEEEHDWFNDEDDPVPADYSFNAGSQKAQARNKAFAGMPAGEDVEKEDVEAWFESNGIGSGSAWNDGEYDEAAAANYGYLKGQAAYQARHASFTGD